MWEPEALTRLITGHLARHAAVEPRDVYKLLYQGVLGPEHLIASAEDFAARLREEYASVSPDDSEPLWEAIRPDGRLGRLNLRPFKARGGDLDRLTAACLRTAEQPWGRADELRAVWAAFVEQCRAGQWEQFSLPEVLPFSEWLEARGYPAAHHSGGYLEANRPAYRLLSAEDLIQWGWDRPARSSRGRRPRSG